ncbi:MAG TPA: hypothetical protein VF765_23110 [Polyangiaceae bacterium]
MTSPPPSFGPLSIGPASSSPIVSPRFTSGIASSPPPSLLGPHEFVSMHVPLVSVPHAPAAAPSPTTPTQRPNVTK